MPNTCPWTPWALCEGSARTVWAPISLSLSGVFLIKWRCPEIAFHDGVFLMSLGLVGCFGGCRSARQWSPPDSSAWTQIYFVLSAHKQAGEPRCLQSQPQCSCLSKPWSDQLSSCVTSEAKLPAIFLPPKYQISNRFPLKKEQGED